MSNIRKMADKGIAYFKRNGFRGFCRRLVRKAAMQRPVDYKKWLKRHSPSREELQRQRSCVFENPVVIGIYVAETDGKKEFSGRLEESLEKQTYPQFRICNSLKEGDVDYFLVVRQNTKLGEDALYTLASEVMSHGEYDLVYGDSDICSCNGEGTEKPECKPQWDIYYLRSRNYIGDGFLLSRKLAAAVSGSDEEDRKRSCWEWLLRCGEQNPRAMRIPRILFHRESDGEKNGSQGKAILQAHYKRLGIQASVEESEKPEIFHTIYQYREQPLVSVVIPNRDNARQMEECVDSIYEKGGYGNIEVLILENHSREPESFSCYKRLQKKYDSLRILTWKEPFHYSKMNNYGAAQAKGTYLLFLNNDTKIINRGCLAELMNGGRQPDVGAVGARLCYGDETIQHGGVVLGYGGVAGHAFEGMKKEQYEAQPSVPALRQFSAVTAACMLVKKKVFQEAGGFSEELAVAYNDIDLCLGIRSCGKKILYCPRARLYHYESQTRGLEMTKEKAARVKREADIFLEKWKDVLRQGDDFYNPNLTLEKADFSLDNSK